MKKLRIIPYAVSKGLNLLVASLKETGVDVKKLKRTGSTYTGSDGSVILNWGSSSRLAISHDIDIINRIGPVVVASNKLETFKRLRLEMTNNIPIWTDLKEVAKELIEEGYTIYCRELLRASEGRGIVIAKRVEELVDCKLYTVDCQTQREVRVHVFNGEVIDFAQKKKMNSERLASIGIETARTDIRNHGNGWVFARANVTIPEDAKEVAIKAVKALGLDFGAVDMSLNLGAPKVLEVNTAPGLEGQTVVSYRNAIIKILNS